MCHRFVHAELAEERSRKVWRRVRLERRDEATRWAVGLQGGVANAMRRVPHKHFIARGDVDAVFDEAPHVRVLGIQPLLKAESEDWNEDGVLIVDGLGDATCWLVFVAHSAAAKRGRGADRDAAMLNTHTSRRRLGCALTMAYSTDHKLSIAPTRRRALRDGRYKTLRLTMTRVHSTTRERASYKRDATTAMSIAERTHEWVC